MVENSLGWPKMLSTYDDFEVTVTITGRKKNASNQGMDIEIPEIDLDIKVADDWTMGIL
jgi:hypothetical protein